MISWRLVVGAGLGLAALSCQHKAQQGAEIARVNDRVLTLDMVRRQVDTTGGVSELQLRMYAARWINAELLYQEAIRRGLDQSEEVNAGMEEVKRKLAIEALLRREVFGDTPLSVPYEEVTQYYIAHELEYTLSEELVWISFVVFSESEPASLFRASVLQSKGWGESIGDYQSSPSFLTRSDSVFHTQSTLYPAELWKVASTLGMREVSFPIKTSAGYFIILSLGHFRRGERTPLPRVEDDIRHRILIERRQQRYSDYIEALRKSHDVRVNLSGMDTGSRPQNIE